MAANKSEANVRMAAKVLDHVTAADEGGGTNRNIKRDHLCRRVARPRLSRGRGADGSSRRGRTTRTAGLYQMLMSERPFGISLKPLAASSHPARRAHVASGARWAKLAGGLGL